MPKSKVNKNKKGKSPLRRKIKLTIQLIILLTLLTMLGVLLYFYLNYGKTILQLQSEAKYMVDKSTEDTFKSSLTSLVYDSGGYLISELKAEKDVYYINYEDIPTAAIDAFLATEDRKFFEHDGIDYWANVRAAIALIKHKGQITQGASTITQQLARGIFLTQEVTYTRKIKELFVAQEIEKRYDKYEIMEYYLNSIYFANGHYGIQAAAQAYFGKGVSSLSLSQISFLCAIPNNPNLYNPLTNKGNTLKRRDRILKQMYENEMISQEDYEKALEEKITLIDTSSDKKNYVETYAYYCAIRALMKEQGFEFLYQFDSKEEEEAYEEAYEDLYYSFQKDLYVKGYRIYTSIDLDKQKLLQQKLDDSLAEFEDKNTEGIYKMQGAAVCIDNDTGRIVSVVGGREQELGGYTLNRAFQSYRQPGSAIKPLIVYTPAFERDYTPESLVDDTYFEGGPKNSGGSYLGEIKLQKAIESSKNVIAWKVFEEITPKVGLSYLHKMNFARLSEQDYILAASLGGFTYGVSPVEMAAAFSALENDGYYREPTCIVKIMDAEGNEIVSDSTHSKQIYETNGARIMTEALTGVIKRGTAKGKGLSHTISAGKTGTTNDKKDGWFVGYTPYYTTSVWVGYDIPESVKNLMGSTYPLKIWHNFMEEIHTSSMNRDFEYYDWRAVLKAEEEERKRLEELENQLTPTPSITLTPIPDYVEPEGNTEENQDKFSDENLEDEYWEEEFWEEDMNSEEDDTIEDPEEYTEEDYDGEDTNPEEGFEEDPLEEGFISEEEEETLE